MRKDFSSPTSPPFLLLQCEQADLHRALIACVRFSKLDPLFVWVLITAQSTSGAEGWLRLECWSERAGARIWAEIPACVAFAGRIALPFQPLATLVAQMRPGMVQLAQGQVSDTNALAPFRLDGVPVFTADPVLTLEQVSRSQRGTQSTHRSRLRALPPTELGPIPPVHQEPGPLMAHVSVKQWQHALASCLLLTRERAQPLAATPSMNHELVLVRFAPARWELLASTPTRLVRALLPLQTSGVEVPLPSALFPGPVLAWICRSLQEARETGPLALSVGGSQEQNQVELLVKTSTATFVCRSIQQTIPLVWEKPLHWPSLVEVMVPRTALSRALNFLATAKHQTDWDGHILAQVKNGVLLLQWIVEADHHLAGQREIPLVSPVPALAPVLVNLSHWRQMLALVPDSQVRLQFGALAGKTQGDLGFLRLTCSGDAPIFMMSLSKRSEKASPPSPIPKKEEAVVASI